MFEFHGWITVRVQDEDDPVLSVIAEREEQALAFVNHAVEKFGDAFSLFETRRTSNGLLVLLTHGLRNHPYEHVLSLFRAVAKQLPDSYGLLYIHDDESPDHGNAFRVWRVAMGELSEHDDPFLSPYIPTVEKPWGEGS